MSAAAALLPSLLHSQGAHVLLEPSPLAKPAMVRNSLGQSWVCPIQQDQAYGFLSGRPWRLRNEKQIRVMSPLMVSQSLRVFCSSNINIILLWPVCCRDSKAVESSYAPSRDFTCMGIHEVLKKSLQALCPQRA